MSAMIAAWIASTLCLWIGWAWGYMAGKHAERKRDDA